MGVVAVVVVVALFTEKIWDVSEASKGRKGDKEEKDFEGEDIVWAKAWKKESPGRVCGTGLAQ